MPSHRGRLVAVVAVRPRVLGTLVERNTDDCAASQAAWFSSRVDACWAGMRTTRLKRGPRPVKVVELPTVILAHGIAAGSSPVCVTSL